MVSLFGGSITCNLPANVIDVSNFRQVPDNQEVFLIESDKDKSIIIELLESPSEDIHQSLKLHLGDILEIDTDKVELDPTQIKHINDVYIVRSNVITLGLLRIKQFNVDILMNISKVIPKGQTQDLTNDENDLNEDEKIIETGLNSLKIIDQSLFSG